MSDDALLHAVALAAVVALLGTAAGTIAGLRFFPGFRSREQKIGDYRRDRVPATAATSSRLPCVIGPAMIGGLTVAIVVTARAWPVDTRRLIFLLTVCWAEFLLGWVDDIHKSRGAGLSERVRLLAHGAIAIAAGGMFLALGLAHGGAAQEAVSALLVAVVLVFFVLSAGFSDGVDGLTASLATLSAVPFVLLAAVWGSHTLGVTAGAATGMSAGALLFNLPSNWTRTGTAPRRARAYVGDSGSLLAGAVVACLAIISGSIAALLLLAAGFAIEGAGVFLQTGVLTPIFRRRLHQVRFSGAITFVPHTEFPLPFLATPLHHHLNLIGLPPLAVGAFFWCLQIVTAAVCCLALLTAWAWPTATLWLVGVSVLMVVGIAVAATSATFLLADRGSNGSFLVVCRGLPARLGRLPLYWAAEKLPGVLASPTHRGWLGRRLPRYDSLAVAASCAGDNGNWPDADQLLNRLPPLNMLLRADAALLAVRRAVTEGTLAILIDRWRDALRAVYQEGRLDLVLDDLATQAEERSEQSLAVALRAAMATPPTGDTVVKRWR